MEHKYFNLPNNKFETFDFNSLDLQELEKAIKLGLEKTSHKVKKIASSTEAPTFENTLVALETSNEDLESVLSILFYLFSSHTNDEIQNMVETFSPELSKLGNEILLNPELFSRIKTVYKNEFKGSNLNPEQKMLLEKTYKSFVQNGALLSEDDKKKLTELDEKLSRLSPKFSKNILSATNAFEWTTTQENDLAGLPESIKEAALIDAKEKGLSSGTYFFSLHYPSLLPMLKYNSNRKIREHFYRANSTKAVTGEFSNQNIILEMVKLRDEKAKLLGLKNYAELILQDRMAKTPDEVFSFLAEFEKHCLNKAKKEVHEVTAYAESTDGITDFKPWDFSYYSEKLRQERFNINDEETKPYFSLENVLKGAFTHAKKLYGLNFTETQEVSKYQKDVRTFEVTSDKGHIGVFYVDFFPRESKRSGAWCSGFREQGLFKDSIKRPLVGIVCNFTKPTGNKPSLLTYNEVRTLFHEFGHALHALLSQCTYRSLAGTNVYWDFVELPSQIMENWTLENESLELFATHYQTGEAIPKELIEKLKKAQTFLTGYSCVRQINFANLDMKWHTTNPSDITNVLDFEKKITEPFKLFEPIEGANFSCSFSHIFAGGYAAGYYSYKWAEVLDADAFEYFKEKGVFNPDVAKSFKENILERGGTEHPEKLYIKFRGRKPSVTALLKRDQLI